jgi:hypothetical protein
MEGRKYSTGTKGRLKRHADLCRDAIHANAPNFGLAREFIESIDPDGEDAVWQRFQEPEHVLGELSAWLGGESAPEKAPPPVAFKAAELEKPAELPEEWKAVVDRVRRWLASPEGEKALEFQSPTGAAEIVLKRIEALLDTRRH